MDEVMMRLLERLLGHGHDRETSQIFAFYRMMRDQPGVQPEAFLKQYPNSKAVYPVILLFARALERNRDDELTGRDRLAARLLGKKLGNGHYQILFRVGKGGMGEVYVASAANTLNDGDLVALKTLHTKTSAGKERDASVVADLKRRIVKEAQALRRVTNHDNVVQFRHAGYDPPPTNMVYIVTDFIEGRSLAELVDESFLEKLPQSEVLWLIREACKGLIAIHTAPILPTKPHQPGGGGPNSANGSGKLLHRDIKLSNILLDIGGNVKLVDLGLAGSAGITTMVWGTDAFMAPEQASATDILDERVDVYSLGKTFYSLLCRIPNPLGATPDANDGKWNGIPPAYVDTILKATAFAAKDRYRDAIEFLAALDGIEGASQPEMARRRVRQLIAAEDQEVNICVAQDLAACRDRGYRSRRWLLRPVVLGAASLFGSTLFFYLYQPSVVKNEDRGMNNIDPVEILPEKPITGTIDVLIWHPGDPERQELSLKKPSSLPLRQGDQIRVSAKISRKAFLYIIWIDANGEPQPVYPWIPGTWELPMGVEKPNESVSLPESTGKDVGGWGLKSESGMETLLLLASDIPRASFHESLVDFRKILADLPRPAVQDNRALVWFTKTGAVRAEDDPHRGPEFFNIQKIDDPLLQAQERIRLGFGKYFTLIEAVSFANQTR